MSFVVVAAVATIAATATSVYGSVQAGKAAEDAAKEQARQEKIQAEADELLRREELNRKAAAMVAAASTAGYTGETPKSIGLYSAEQTGKSERGISLSTKLRNAQTIRSGQAAKAAGYTQATSTLLNAVPDLIAAGGTIKNKLSTPKEGGS